MARNSKLCLLVLTALCMPTSSCDCNGAKKPAVEMEVKTLPQTIDEDSPRLPGASYHYEKMELPAHFLVESEGFLGQIPLVESDNTPKHNPITDGGATLGRVLFYDRNLSRNRTTSCASCHRAEHGFSDNRILSRGFEGDQTARHSMGLTNARFYKPGTFFWDQRAGTLEKQVLDPFLNVVEMGMNLERLQERLEEASYYPALFKMAFGDSTLSTDRMSLALAQFVRSMVSMTSKYDEGRGMVARRSQDFPNFTESENLGKKLFVNPLSEGGMGCFACHQGEGFVAARAQSNGLDDAFITDLGYGALTGIETDIGTFKVPSLRNVGLTQPYMHDGRFSTLEEVLHHYSEGVVPTANLRPPLSESPQKNMTQEEQAALVAFLHTLSDVKMMKDPKFQDPFVGRAKEFQPPQH